MRWAEVETLKLYLEIEKMRSKPLRPLSLEAETIGVRLPCFCSAGCQRMRSICRHDVRGGGRNLDKATREGSAVRSRLPKRAGGGAGCGDHSTGAAGHYRSAARPMDAHGFTTRATNGRVQRYHRIPWKLTPRSVQTSEPYSSKRAARHQGLRCGRGAEDVG